MFFLQIACPRVCAGKTINFGGEDVLIATLIGQGGFAKVYKVVTDENKTLALKAGCELPLSCMLGTQHIVLRCCSFSMRCHLARGKCTYAQR